MIHKITNKIQYNTYNTIQYNEIQYIQCVCCILFTIMFVSEHVCVIIVCGCVHNLFCVDTFPPYGAVICCVRSVCWDGRGRGGEFLGRPCRGCQMTP